MGIQVFQGEAEGAYTLLPTDSKDQASSPHRVELTCLLMYVAMRDTVAGEAGLRYTTRTHQVL